MDKMTYYDAYRNKLEFTPEEIILKIEASIRELEAIINAKKQVDNSINGILCKQFHYWNGNTGTAICYIPLIPYHTIRSTSTSNDHICMMPHPVSYRNGGLSHSDIDTNNTTFVSNCRKLIAELQNILSLYKNNNRARYGRLGITLIENVGVNDWIVTYLMHDDRFCYKCKSFFGVNQSINSHQRTKTCKVATMNNDTESAGMVRLADQALINAVVKLNIEHKEVPTAIDFFAPKWVVDAYKVFKDNANDKNKFGGMKLEEYMKTVAMESPE
jgi:hypothetical protein